MYKGLAAALIAFLLISNGCSKENDYSTWEIRGGNNKQNHYSSLNQIDTTNVSQLEVAWTYHSGGADTATDYSQIQANPIIIGNTLYSTSPKLKLFALNASTGEQKWMFNPYENTDDHPPAGNSNRGASYWQEGEEHRILYTAGSWLYAIDANTGKPVKAFGQGGKVSLKTGFKEKEKDLYAVATSPGIIYQDLIIIGSRVSEGQAAAPGDIRAFNVRTGTLEWTFHTIPHPGEFGYDTWKNPDAWRKIGGANSWAGMALDEERGVVYIPLGSASPDFYGGDRKGKNLFANSLLALNATKGKRIWHYQTVHHDLWDRDLPSPPTLVTVNHKGVKIDAVAQTTKTGFVFLFNRETGEPLFNIEDIQVPAKSPLEGEEVWPTQPVPAKPNPLMRQRMGINDINPYVSEEEKDILREKMTGLQRGDMFNPPSLQGTLNFPGTDGGAEWGGSAFDPESGFLYVNTNEIPWILQMIDKSPATATSTSSAISQSQAIGRRTYMSNCVACHGTNLKGSGRSPSLINIEQQRTPHEMIELINNGSGMMPAFKRIPEARKKAIVNFLLKKDHFKINLNEISDKEEIVDNNSSERYVLNGYQKFRTKKGYPAISPPWGRLTAVDLNSGDHVWQIPLGEYPELRARGVPKTGTENYGGPAVTKSGLVFIAATPDKKFKAYNKKTGKLLWETNLPYAGFATPSIYQVDNKEYIVIACGGGKLGAESGDVYIAFSLP